MSESWRSRVERCMINWWPCYRRTGGRVIQLSGDYRKMRVRLKLNWRTRNYVGTIFGGSMYAAVDPFYMLMLIKILGPDYIVWDKAAAIRFHKPGRSVLYADFSLTQSETDEIIEALEEKTHINRHFKVDLVDSKGSVYAAIDKTLYIARSKNGRTQNRAPRTPK